MLKLKWKELLSCQIYCLQEPSIGFQISVSMQECRERDVFDAVAAWAYGIDGADSERLAQCMADVEGLLLLIRFPLMTPSELQVILFYAPVPLWKLTEAAPFTTAYHIQISNPPAELICRHHCFLLSIPGFLSLQLACQAVRLDLHCPYRS